MYYTFKMYFLGGYKGESFLQVKTELISKTTLGTGTCSVCFYSSMIQNMLEKSKILLHGRNLIRKHGAVILLPGACGEIVEGLRSKLYKIGRRIGNRMVKQE